MSRHQHVVVGTLGQCNNNVVTLGKLLDRCCVIAVGRNIEKDYSYFKYKICICFPYFISAISVRDSEDKSINIGKHLNSSMNSKT